MSQRAHFLNAASIDARREFLVYAAVGVVSNAALYVLYLGLAALGAGHKTAMSALFATGVLFTFVLNRRWTFRHSGAVSGSALRYAWVYLLAYLGNIAALALLVDVVHLPHRIVVLVLIVATACIMFLLQKFWVFSDRAAGS